MERGSLHLLSKKPELRDEAHAFQIFKKLADADYIPAILQVAELYKTGIGVPKDLPAALALYEKAAEKGASGARARADDIRKLQAAAEVSTKPVQRVAAPEHSSVVSQAATTDWKGILDGVAFGWPSDGPLLQGFQESRKGVSLGGRAGDIVRAAAAGRVIFSGAGPRGYGNLIIIKHDNELLSVYAHNRALAAKEGQLVKLGQKIAELGSSGTDRDKLHFEIRRQGAPVDPITVLPVVRTQ